ncbi:hypothetical protein MRX96_010511 [Rhipicephalus microplus]
MLVRLETRSINRCDICVATRLAVAGAKRLLKGCLAAPCSRNSFSLANKFGCENRLTTVKEFAVANINNVMEDIRYDGLHTFTPQVRALARGESNDGSPLAEPSRYRRYRERSSDAGRCCIMTAGLCVAPPWETAAA